MRFLAFLFFSTLIFAVDFDVALIGSSPFSLFEALYQVHSGKSVIIFEEAAECGGAWKAIEVCGIANVDLGCHQIGCDVELKVFLEEYAGCKIVSHDNPLMPFNDSLTSPNGFYFSRGSYELITHLLQLIEETPIVLLNHCRVENISIEPLRKEILLYTKDRTFTASKLIVTPMSCIVGPLQNYTKSKYYHLYLLVQDPTPPRFIYRGSVGPEISRGMNLTHYVGLSGTGRHLLVVQVRNEETLKNEEEILAVLKERKLIDSSAYILKTEQYIYETGSFDQNLIDEWGAQELIEWMQTGHISRFSNYMAKWKSVLKPYVVREED